MRSFPDEIGAVALGAKFAGLDWSYVLVHPAYYYGSTVLGMISVVLDWSVKIFNVHHEIALLHIQ